MRRVNLFISIFLLFLLSAVSLYAAEDERAPYAPHEILVKFKSPKPTAVTSISKEEAKYVNELSRRLKNRERLTVVRKRKISTSNIYHLTLSKDDLINSKEDAVQKSVKITNSDPNVLYSEPNYILKADKIPNDPKFNKLWGLHNTGQEIGPDYDIITGTPDADIDAPGAWDIINASEIIVAVIDSGVDYTHEDLAANMWTNSNGGHGYDYANNDTEPIDDNGHGTHVAGTIGAVGNNGVGVTGVCWNVKIMAVKFLDGDGVGYVSDAILAIKYAVDNGAKVLSNSWGGGDYSRALKEVIAETHNAGCLFIAAAGNEGLNTDINPHYPSCYNVPNVISVAATNLDDGLADEINDYYSSNYGKDTVDLAAPGVRIGSTYPGNRYVYDWGTSMATPHVSGAAALVWAKNPTLSNIQVKDIILGSVDTLSSLQGKVSTGGRLNVLNALRQVPSPPVTDPSPQPDPDANVIFSDDMEGGPSNWSAQSPWGIVTTGYNSSHSWHDSPDGNYGNNVNANLYLRSINLSNQTSAWLTFSHKYMLEKDYDYGYVYVSTDNGATWTLLKQFNGEQSSWIQEDINLSSYCSYNNVKIRFELVTDYYVTYDGWYIDDVVITGDKPPISDSVIFSDDMEGGPSNWSAQSPWGIVTTDDNPSHSWHDSPDGDYGDNVNAKLDLISINLSNQNYARLTFSHKYVLEKNYDYGYVYVSTDNGATWTLLEQFNGEQSSWIQEDINLSSYCGYNNVKIRFELVTDYSITCDGWYIDDVEITGNRPPAREPNILIEPSGIPMVEVGNNGTTTQTFLIKNIGNEVLTYTIAGQNTNGTAILNPCEAESNPEQETQTLSINGSQWQIIRNEKTGTIHRAYGGNLSFLGLDSADINAEALENTSRNFIADNYALFKISESDLILLRNEKHSHQWYITFQQKYNDIPVHNAKIELRYSDINGRLTLFGSDAHPDINIPTTPSITEEEAQEIVKGDAGFRGAEDQLRTTQLLILPVENQDNIEYYLVYKVILFTKYPPHTWLYFINAIDGSIIMKRDVIKDAEISGHVRGGIYPLYPTDSEIPEEFPNQQIDVSSAGSDITDVSGYYNVSVSGSGDHTITARMSGPNLIVWNHPDYTTPYASYTGTGNISSPHHIEWNGSNSNSNSNAAERNIFYHTQVGYLKIKEIDPDFTGVDYQAEAWANIADYSNAYFDGYNYGYGDGKGGGDWLNLGWTSEVMYHEYGHGIMHFQYNEYWGNTLEFDSLHEGFADYFACTITDEPLIGEERGPGYPVLRNLALIPKATPSNTEPECHKRGQVISGALWDLRGVLGAELTDHLFHFARYGHGTTFYEYYIDFLLEDDDDGNWENGTPHSQDIYDAFAPHDIAYVDPVEPNDDIAPSVTNNLVAINSNYNSVTLTWTAPGDDGNSGRAHSYDIRYSISPITGANWSSVSQLNGEPYPDSPGAAETVTVLGLEPDTSYYFALRTRDNRENWSPLSNMTARTTGTAKIIYSDDMEGDTSGWTTNGSWEITSGGYNSAYCWTDTPGGNYGNNANYILISPTFNLTDSQNTTLNFWHKYNLEEGYDWGHIEITTNGGLTWEIIKTYSGQNPNWANSTVDLSAYDGQGSVKLRFRLYSDSCTTYDGWYIDDVKIMSGSGSGPADWLTFEPASGSIAPGAEEIITLSYDATGLPPAIVYGTSLYIISDDPDTPNIALSVAMGVALPPGAPAGLTVVPGDSKVDLSWNPNLEPDLAGYNVYRKIVSGFSASIRTTGMPVCNIQAKLSESLNLVKIFLTGELNIDVLLNLNLSIYENMGNYAIGEVTNSELDVLSDNGFTYVILDTNSQTRQYYTVWAPTQEILETINQYATALETDINTAIIHTDEQTAEEIPLHGFQIRPIRRSPLVPGEKTIVSYGVPSVNTSKEELIREMVAKVEEPSVENYIQTLQDFDTRYTYTSGYDNSAAYTLDKFRKMGLQAEYHQFTINDYTKTNIVATLTGKTKPDEIFIICGHLDCISDDKWNNAPGAEDNASGSSTVLEAARILSQYEFDSTIKFILFGGEEQGLYGSYYYADEMADRGINIAGVLNFDMIAYLDTSTWDLSIISHSGHQALAETVVYSANTYTSINAINGVDDGSAWSDHWYFWQRGYPAICGIEHSSDHFYRWYHQTTDTIDKISTVFAAEVAKLGIATLSELANPVISEPPVPTYKKINNTLVTTTNYKDTTVTNATTYMYVVTAVDNAGNESVYSNEVSATPGPKPQPPKNLAPLATATASSEYSSGYRAGNAIDGIIGAWDQGEWAAQGSWDRTPSLKLEWSSPRTVNKIVIYGRPNKYDSIQNAKITLSNGTSITLGEIPIGGAAKTIYFTPVDITWLKFKVLETNAWNPGLTEIEVYYEPKTQDNSNIALSATASASSEYSAQYSASNVIDGIIGQWDAGEWAARGSWDRNPSLKLTWSSPQTVNKIVIYGRPNKYDSIQNARITFSNGTSMTLGEIPIGGAAKVIYFPAAQITWLEFKVLETNAWNPGLTEIEVYYEPPGTNTSNIARQSSATVSSEYSSAYRASNAIDGIIGAWDQGEWASQGSWDRNPWLKLTWSSPQTVNKVVIYGRPNKYDSIQNARITFSNGYSVTLGEIPIGGAAKEIYFPTMQIRWLKFEVLEANAWNPGLTEIEVYYVQNNISSNEVTSPIYQGEVISPNLTLLSNPDTDGDGIYNKYDSFDIDSAEWIDTDGDGIGNNADTDDDDDGVLDENDDFSYDPARAQSKNEFLISASMPATRDTENAKKSYENNLDVLDIVNPVWYTMQSDGTLVCTVNIINDILDKASANGILVIPYINNYDSTAGGFDPARVSMVINDVNLTITHIQNIVNEVITKGYDGINIDYERCYAADRDVFTGFINNLAAALHNNGKILEVSVHAKTYEPGSSDGTQSQDWAALGQIVDYFKVMTYDYQWSASMAGPRAPVDWIDRVTSSALTLVDSKKLVMGVPFYGYDWAETKGTEKTYLEVQGLITSYNIIPNWDNSVQEPYFEYDDGTDYHTVYYQNSESVSYKLDLFYYYYNVKGISIYRIGSEDPYNWGIIRNLLGITSTNNE